MKFLPVLVLLVILFSSGCERPVELDNEFDAIPPAVPVGARLFYAGDGYAIIEWLGNSEIDLKGYNIYRKSNNSDFKFIYFTQNEYYYDDSLSYNDTVFYKVTSIDFSNNESNSSNEIQALPLNKFAPAPPVGLSINARNWENNKSVVLNWLPNDEADIFSFYVYRSTVPGFNPDTASYIGSSNTNEFEDTGNLEFYKSYYYKIVAVDKGNLGSLPSVEISDQLLEIPQILSPVNNSTINRLTEVVIKTIKTPANYQIVISENIFFDEIYKKEINISETNSNYTIPVQPYLSYNKTYYLRVITYTKSSPNSISPPVIFTLKF